MYTLDNVRTDVIESGSEKRTITVYSAMGARLFSVAFDLPKVSML